MQIQKMNSQLPLPVFKGVNAKNTKVEEPFQKNDNKKIILALGGLAIAGGALIITAVKGRGDKVSNAVANNLPETIVENCLQDKLITSFENDEGTISIFKKSDGEFLTLKSKSDGKIWHDFEYEDKDGLTVFVRHGLRLSAINERFTFKDLKPGKPVVTSRTYGKDGTTIIKEYAASVNNRNVKYINYFERRPDGSTIETTKFTPGQVSLVRTSCVTKEEIPKEDYKKTLIDCDLNEELNSKYYSEDYDHHFISRVTKTPDGITTKEEHLLKYFEDFDAPETYIPPTFSLPKSILAKRTTVLDESGKIISKKIEPVKTKTKYPPAVRWKKHLKNGETGFYEDKRLCAKTKKGIYDSDTGMFKVAYNNDPFNKAKADEWVLIDKDAKFPFFRR